MIAIANGDSLLPDVEDWMDRDDEDDGSCVDGPDANFVAFPQQAFRIMVRPAWWPRCRPARACPLYPLTPAAACSACIMPLLAKPIILSRTESELQQFL